MTVFQNHLSAKEFWTPAIRVEDRILLLTKYLSHVVHKTVKTATDILREGECHRQLPVHILENYICQIIKIYSTLIYSFSAALQQQSSEKSVKFSLLPLLGFNDKTPISIYYNKLHYVLATLINGLSSSDVGNRIVTSSDNVTCSRLFEWWSDHVVGLSPEEYGILKNFTCDLVPDNFNAYTDLYMAEESLWSKPVNSYRSYTITSIGDLYEFAFEVRNIVKRTEGKDVEIEIPFSMSYLSTTLQKLKDALEFHDNEETARSQEKVSRLFRRAFEQSSSTRLRSSIRCFRSYEGAITESSSRVSPRV